MRQGLQEISFFCKMFDRTGNYRVRTSIVTVVAPTTTYTAANTDTAIIRRIYFLILCDCCSQLETLSLSCGIADLVATCYGGRNRKCAEEFARRVLDGGHTLDRDSDSLHELWRVIEKDILNGQKLQGVDTCQEVMTMLVEHYRKENAINGNSRDVALDFPLLCRIHAIAFSGESFRTLFQWRDINN